MDDRVLVDTSVWIEYFRRKGSPVASLLRDIVKQNRACYAGPVAVELIQGAKTEKEVEVINRLLDMITYVDATRSHFHHAGDLSRTAAREGKIFSTVDMLLAAIAHDEGLILFSLDRHFGEISQYCSLQLVEIPGPEVGD